jgi:uncharacterized protein YyaL (SSP411 family)
MKFSNSKFQVFLIVATATVFVWWSNISSLQAAESDQTAPKETANHNRLINESSPYLLQHATNPVFWYPWSDEAFEKARDLLAEAYDPKYGGFGQAPKFPSPHKLTFLLRRYHYKEDELALTMVEKTLAQMRFGGIFDHIGFGFHRYSTDG